MGQGAVNQELSYTNSDPAGGQLRERGLQAPMWSQMWVRPGVLQVWVLWGGDFCSGHGQSAEVEREGLQGLGSAFLWGWGCTAGLGEVKGPGPGPGQGLSEQGRQLRAGPQGLCLSFLLFLSMFKKDIFFYSLYCIKIHIKFTMLVIFKLK